MSDFTVYNNLEVKVIEELNDRVKMLTDLVEAMIPVNQDMYNKIEFLEKRLKLQEDTNDYQDKEIEDIMKIVNHDGMGTK